MLRGSDKVVRAEHHVVKPFFGDAKKIIQAFEFGKIPDKCDHVA
jgi:hypothetical protein